MSLKPYPKYKDSDVAWLGDVPEHWPIISVKRLVKLQSGDFITGEQIDDCGTIPVYGGNGLRGFTDEHTHEGDYVLVGRQGALCGNVNYTTGKFWASEHAVVASPIQSIATRWFGELLRSMNLNQYSVSAAQPGLSVEVISNLKIPHPPQKEQIDISTFLERETAKIDDLVAEQEKLIALLAEKRQATISYAVTKGLNPDASKKDSGVEWLGEIPTHWEVQMLKRAFRSIDYGISDALEPEGAVAILRMGNISGGCVFLDDLKFTVSVDAALLLEPGDLLYNRTNSLDQIAKVGLVTNLPGCPLSFASYLVRLRSNASNEPSYMAYVLNTNRVLLEARSRAFVAIGQCNLNPTRYGEIYVAIPPIYEQREITAFLDIELGKIDDLTTEATHVIDLLKERRTALISAAVTGKIDVRGAFGTEKAA